MPNGLPNRRPYYKGSTHPAGDPRWQRLVKAAAGGSAAPLPPYPFMVGVNGINVDLTGHGFANLVGTIKPNGNTYSWWFVYGTVLPLAITNAGIAGQTTASTAVTDTVNTATAVTEITGLTVGTTYYVALIAQTSNSTVISNTLSFVAVAPSVPASQPITPPGQPSVTIPHLQVPFQLVTTGNRAGAVTVEQDTLEEIVSCVTAVVDCPVGACPQLPDFGIPSPTFAQAPIQTAELVAAIQTFEPRATEDAVSSLLGDQVSWGIQLNTSTRSARDV